MVGCAVLYCVALFCVVVSCVDLCCMMVFGIAPFSVWYWTGLDLIVLDWIVSSCRVTYIVVWCCRLLDSIVLCCTLLCCTVLLCVMCVLYYVAGFCVVVN